MSAQPARAFDRRLLKLGAGELPALSGAVGLGVLIGATRVGQGFVLARAFAAIITRSGWGHILPWLGVAVALIAVRAVATALQGAAMAGASVRITTSLRVRLVEAILKRGPAWVSRERSGELEAVMVDGVEKLDAYFRLFLAKVIVAGITAIIIIAIVITIDPVVGSIIGGLALVVMLIPSVEYRGLSTRMRFWSENYRPLAAEFVDNLQGMSTLKIFGVARRRGNELRERSGNVRHAAEKLVSASGVFWGLMTLAAGGGVAAGLVAGALRHAGGHLSTPNLLLLLLLAGECFLPAREIHDAMHLAVWGMSKIERAFSILATTPSRADLLENVSIPNTSVRFENVSFRYRADGAKALDHVSFDVPEGQTLAIVGASGAGKTTIASLLLRFFDPQEGTIFIGGVDVGTVDADVVRSRIALVPQDTFLFHASVLDNLLLAHPTADRAAIERACSLANASSFISSLPDGYETIVGERGLRLSGGERQRIAIARGLLKNAPILILDEATSNVDVASEAAIRSSLETLRHGRTTLVIAHRLSTVRHADRILVLHEGTVVEEGTHAELVSAGGRYAQLIAAQRPA